MSRQLGALGVQAAEVDDAADIRASGGAGHVDRAAVFGVGEVGRRAHRMHQVVDDVHPVERRIQSLGVGQVAADDLDIVAPGRIAELRRGARQHADPQAGIQEARHQPTADVPRRSGNQAERPRMGHVCDS